MRDGRLAEEKRLSDFRKRVAEKSLYPRTGSHGMLFSL
jgi:hypothetical protein